MKNKNYKVNKIKVLNGKLKANLNNHLLVIYSQSQCFFSKDHPCAWEITASVVKMIAMDMQPYSIVEDCSFRKLCSVMEPTYQLPSTTTFSRNIVPAVYEEQVKNLKTELSTDIENGLHSLSLTTDMWNSRAEISHFPGNHTGSGIDTNLWQLLQSWWLDNVSVPLFVVSNNGRNIGSALSAIHDAKEGLGVLDLLVSVREIVSYYNHSSVARGRLHSKQKQMGLPEYHLVQMVDTSWNSEYLMLSRILEQKEAVIADLFKTGKDGLAAKQ
ncbi:hypothetical protein PR048_025537 [Dryococelus australis]|uniref:Transposase n=1 Tax=Dryococelus australis TaxID=614101 RepID=A0ABQ9GRN4_9NEOP|nr:hypothetical protein PR048_025537 [Dryococelus australis]